MVSEAFDRFSFTYIYRFSQLVIPESPNSIDLEKWTEEELSSSLVFKYAVVTGENSILCARLEQDGESYVAFGISPTGMMAGGEGIIGLPDEGTVQKYTLLGDSPRVQLMPDDKQTLMDTMISQEDGQTIMEFTKLLVEVGENEIVIGENTFLWALGGDNSLGYHSGGRGDFTVELTAMESDAGTPGKCKFQFLHDGYTSSLSINHSHIYTAPSPGGSGMDETTPGMTKTVAPTGGDIDRGTPAPTATPDTPTPPTPPTEPVPSPPSGAARQMIGTALGAGMIAAWFGM